MPYVPSDEVIKKCLSLNKKIYLRRCSNLRDKFCIDVDEDPQAPVYVTFQGTQAGSLKDWCRNFRITHPVAILLMLLNFVLLTYFVFAKKSIVVIIFLFISYLLGFWMVEVVSFYKRLNSERCLPQKWDVHLGFSELVDEFIENFETKSIPTDRSIVVTGHSQGGGVGVGAVLALEEKGYKNVKGVFFAPGPYLFNSLKLMLLFTTEYKKEIQRVKNFLLENTCSVYIKRDAILAGYNNVFMPLGHLCLIGPGAGLSPSNRKAINGTVFLYLIFGLGFIACLLVLIHFRFSEYQIDVELVKMIMIFWSPFILIQSQLLIGVFRHSFNNYHFYGHGEF